MHNVEVDVRNIIKQINSKLERKSQLRMERELDKQELCKVLVVESDPIYATFWKRILRSVSPEVAVDWASTMESAEKLLLLENTRGCVYDLIILDILLGGSANGIQLWTRFKQSGKSFLFVSSLPMHGYIGALHKKEDSYPRCMVKPLDASRCREAVSCLLQSHQVWSDQNMAHA